MDILEVSLNFDLDVYRRKGLSRRNIGQNTLEMFAPGKNIVT